jgi:hypothetical protein
MKLRCFSLCLYLFLHIHNSMQYSYELWHEMFHRLQFYFTLEVLLYHAVDKQDGHAKVQRNYMPMCLAKKTFLVIVISYEVVVNDSKFLVRYKWKYIIMDEVRHLLRNPLCSIFEWRSSLCPLLHNYSLVHENPSIVKLLLNLKDVLLFR